jgi:hypothetical protein
MPPIYCRAMVRRDGTAKELARAGDGAVPCYISLAGASPARVTAGGPGSRRPCRRETDGTKRRVRSLCRGGSNEAGRNTVNAEEASSEYQPKGVWECRADHVAAKAMHSACRGPANVLGLPGVMAAARFDREVWNTRDPSRWLTSSKDRAYKAGAESVWSRAGVRGAHGTEEGGDNSLEGRGPALVMLALQVSARACP